MADQAAARRKLLIVLGTGVFLPRAAHAQAAAKIARVGVLARESLDEPPLASLRAALKELGYVEGSSLVLEHVALREGYERYRDYAAEVVRRQVHVIVTNGFTITQATKAVTRSVPIVMVIGLDPVRLALVSNLARPGGNLTGLVEMSQELIGKRLELLRDLIPGLREVAMLWHSGAEGEADSVRVAEAEAGRLGIALRTFQWRRPNELESALAAIAKAKPDALMPHQSAILNQQLATVARFAVDRRLPAIYGHKRFPELGGLVSYSADRDALFRRAAVYVDKILKGANPGELPIEQATQFELVVNLKTAKALGVAIPQSVLVRADRLIE